MSAEQKYKEAEINYKLKIGDVVQIKSAFGTHNHKIIRVTKTMAICKFHRFPNTNCFGFTLKPFDTWNNNQYIVYELLTP